MNILLFNCKYYFNQVIYSIDENLFTLSIDMEEKMDNTEITLQELLNILRKKLGLIILATLTGLLFTSFYTYFIVTPQYSSTTQLLVNQNRSEQTSVELNDINTNIRLIDTYRELITGPAILNEVSEELNGQFTTEQLASMISINSPQDAQVFNVTINTTNPYNAADIANAVATTFQNEIGDIMNSVDNVVIVYEAVPRTMPVSPNHTLNLAIGVVLGLMVGVGIVFLQFALDGTLRETEFITQEIGWNDLGAVHEFKPEEVSAANRKRKMASKKRLSRV